MEGVGLSSILFGHQFVSKVEPTEEQGQEERHGLHREPVAEQEAAEETVSETPQTFEPV